MKLQAEASGILNWMIEGLLKWNDTGLNPPQIVIDAGEDYLKENDLVAQFLNEETTNREGDSVSISELFKRYLLWCEDSGIEFKATKQTLSKKIESKGYAKTVIGNIRSWKDIILKEHTVEQSQNRIKEDKSFSWKIRAD